MKKTLIISFAIFLFGLSSLAEDIHLESVAGRAKGNGEANSLGIGGTVFSTWGFTYRRYFSSGFGVAANIGGWFNGQTGRIGFAPGMTYTFAHHYFSNSSLPSSSLRIFAVVYGAFVYHHDYLYHRLEADKEKEVTRSYFDVGLGAGPGAEFFFSPHFAIHLELPWMTIIRIDSKEVKFQSSYPHFGGGISYYF